jgi:hypothetical protein
MNSSVPILDEPATANSELAKTLGDLDSISQALLSALPQAKAWQRQRQLRVHLAQLDREVQVARMTVVMGRDQAEVKQAANACCTTLRAANSFVAGGRADMGTKAAVRFAFELGQKIDRLLAS